MTKDKYYITIENDVDIEETNSVIHIRMTHDPTNTLRDFSYVDLDKLNKKVLKWEVSDPGASNGYGIDKVDGKTTNFAPDLINYIKSYNSLASLASSQETSQEINYSDSSKAFSFLIKWKEEVTNYVMPVVANQNTKTVELNSYCKTTKIAKSEMTCTLPKGTLGNGNWIISLKNDCYDEKDIITLKITGAGLPSSYDDDYDNSSRMINAIYALILLGLII